MFGDKLYILYSMLFNLMHYTLWNCTVGNILLLNYIAVSNRPWNILSLHKSQALSFMNADYVPIWKRSLNDTAVNSTGKVPTYLRFSHHNLKYLQLTLLYFYKYTILSKIAVVALASSSLSTPNVPSHKYSYGLIKVIDNLCFGLFLNAIKFKNRNLNLEP